MQLIADRSRRRLLLFAALAASIVAGCGRHGVEPTGDSGKAAERHYPPVAGIRNVLLISIDTCRARPAELLRLPAQEHAEHRCPGPRGSLIQEGDGGRCP